MRVDHPLPKLPKDGPCFGRLQKRQKPCVGIAFKSAKKARDHRFCTPKLVGVAGRDEQVVAEAVAHLMQTRERVEILYGTAK